MTMKHAQALATALTERFEAEVESERIGRKGWYRFAVISPLFRKMPQLDRQDQIWAVVDEVLPREATMDISLILAFAPEDLQAA